MRHPHVYGEKVASYNTRRHPRWPYTPPADPELVRLMLDDKETIERFRKGKHE